MSRQAAVSSGSAEGGQRIGDYILGKTIGSGSFGKVKKGVHSASGVTVAIKIINKEKISAKKMDHKVRREIFNLKRFRHPHIIKLYQVMETERDIFLVMEYIQGGELFDYIVQRGKLSEAEARAYYQQMMSAVAYCHSLHVVHRDLKPENLLCASLPTQSHSSAFSPVAQYSIKIADFGLSNIVQDGEFLKTSCGSPNYAAPEVIEGKYYSGEEVDVWSSGVILYALLTARLPFDDDYIPHLFQKIKKGKFKMPSYLSAACQDLIRQLLIVDPLNRITVSEIVQHPWFTVNLPPYLQPYCALASTTEDAGAFGEMLPMMGTGASRWDERVLHDLQTRCPDSWGKLSTHDLIFQLDKEDEIQQQELLASGADIGSATTPLLVAYYLLFDASGFGDRFESASVPQEGSLPDAKRPEESLDSTALAVAALSTSPPLNMRDNQLLLSPLHRAEGVSASPASQAAASSWWSSWSLLSGSASATNASKQNLDGIQQQQYWSLGIPPSAFQAKSNQRLASIPLSLQPPQIMTEVCRVLKQLKFEWKAVTPYQLRCRTPNPRYRPDTAHLSTGSSGSANSILSASNSSWIKIGIQLFKMSSQPVSASSRPNPSGSCLLDFKLIAGDVLIVLQYCVQIMNELAAA